VQVLIDGPCIEVLTDGGSFVHTLRAPVLWDDDAADADGLWI